MGSSKVQASLIYCLTNKSAEDILAFSSAYDINDYNCELFIHTLFMQI